MLIELHQYIGKEITFKGKRCQLIEVLEDGPSLVFMCMDQEMSIQGDLHGNAHRKVHQTYTIPCLSEIQQDLHPTAKEILPDHIHDQLLTFLLKD